MKNLRIIMGLAFVPFSMLGVYAQSTILGNTLSGTAPQPAEFLGSDNGYDVEFRANNVERMRILQANGNVGIGTAFNPAFRLDVDGGDINVNTGNNGYRIAQEYVLWYNNDASNIYVGVGAGDAAATTAFENTFVGNNAGTAITTGDGNTFVGQGAEVANEVEELKQKYRCLAETCFVNFETK